jgi:ankyrin repeat protein
VYSKHCDLLLIDARQEPTSKQREVIDRNMSILRLLGSVGANLNARINTNMHTAAHLAALTSNADALKLLAELGADLNSPSRTTMSALAETPAQIVIKNEDASTFAMLRSLGSACDIRPELVEGSMNKLSRSGLSLFKKWEARRFEIKEGVLSYFK